jgi:hypothetical protein
MIAEFWIKSSRGTDAKEKVKLPDNFSEEDIKHELEDWCSNFGAWHVSCNTVRYGYKVLNDGSKIEDPLIP